MRWKYGAAVGWLAASATACLGFAVGHRHLFYAFMQEPEAALLDCVGDIIPLDFTGSDAMASLLGAADLWENGSGKAASVPDVELLERVRRNFWRAGRGPGLGLPPENLGCFR